MSLLKIQCKYCKTDILTLNHFALCGYESFAVGRPDICAGNFLGRHCFALMYTTGKTLALIFKDSDHIESDKELFSKMLDQFFLGRRDVIIEIKVFEEKIEEQEDDNLEASLLGLASVFTSKRKRFTFIESFTMQEL